jgi:hypothetical protein
MQLHSYMPARPPLTQPVLLRWIRHAQVVLACLMHTMIIAHSFRALVVFAHGTAPARENKGMHDGARSTTSPPPIHTFITLHTTLFHHYMP